MTLFRIMRDGDNRVRRKDGSEEKKLLNRLLEVWIVRPKHLSMSLTLTS